MKNAVLLMLLALVFSLSRSQDLTDYVNLYIGTANEGNTNPGAVMPWGMASISPFNCYDTLNPEAWCRSPYLDGRPYISGFTQLNISGTGCPDLGTFTLMPTSGVLSFISSHNTSAYSDVISRPGYYSAVLDKFGIRAEMTTTMRTTISRYTFPGGESNIMVNLGLNLTTRDGAVIERFSDTEIGGVKTIGNFCGLTATQNVYFYAVVSKAPRAAGVFDGDRKYPYFKRPMAGKNIGAYFVFDTDEGEEVLLKAGFSFVSVANARMNLEAEQPGFDFDGTLHAAYDAWNHELSRIKVEGGTHNNRVKFYTALYHTLLHPNVFNDVNGEYRGYESNEVFTTSGKDRYSLFSLWDTYRTVHPFLSLVYPAKQSAMVQSLLSMYQEGGWLPRWELAGMETGVMVGDPSLPVIVDSWFRGIRDFDAELAYEAMHNNATADPEINILRPGLEYWLDYGYIPDDAPPVMHRFPKDMYENMLRHRVVWGSVSTSLEYSIADWNLAQFALMLGKQDDHDYFLERSLFYRNNFDPITGFLRPRHSNGDWIEPFDPVSHGHEQSGYTEGSAWTYTFMVPHDIPGLIDLMGGPQLFVGKLQACFDEGHFDVTNEPDIAYPFLFNYVEGEEWRTQRQVRMIIDDEFTTSPDGLPGNDDVGTLSAWLLYAMMGFYPDCPGDMHYQISSPVFSKVTIELDQLYFPGGTFVIEAPNASPDNIYIRAMRLNGEPLEGFRLQHSKITQGGNLFIELSNQKP